MSHALMDRYRLYCGIDIGKATCSVGVLSTDELAIQPFTIPNEPTGFKQLRQNLEILTVQPADILVVLEPTGTFWMPLARHLYRAGYNIVVINPLTVRRHINAMLERNKTDRIDALWLAEIARLAGPHFALWTEPPVIYEELRQRMELRDALVEFRAKQLNRQQAVTGRLLIQRVAHQRREVIDDVDRRVKALEKEMKAVLLADPAWGKTARYLLSIPGLGIYSVAALMVYTMNFTVIDNVDQLASFVGVAPTQRQSGETNHSYIGYSSVPRLRQTLYMCTMSAVRYNPIVTEFYNRLVDRGVGRQKARIACIRKLLKLAWGCAKNQQMFDPNYAVSRRQAASLTQ